jgi:putative ABC transport system permease protein
MMKNYLKMGWRNLVRQKLYSLINILGLAVGLAVCMMIMLYVTHEMSYDSFHKNAKRIFSPHIQVKLGGNTMNMTSFSYVSGPMIKQSQPTVADFMRTLDYFRPVVVSLPSSPETKFSAEKLLFADPGFFNFFSFKLLSGQPAEVLKKPFSVVLSREMAQKYFGETDPIGKTLTIKTDSAYTYQVTGVAENNPSNSSIQFNFVASNAGLMATKEAAMYAGPQAIGSGSFNLYLLLRHPTDTASLSRGLQAINGKNKQFDDEKFTLCPLTDTHLKNNFGDSSNIKYLKIFPIVAVLILLLALVNYMSLSTARATLRAKEVGVRKVSGASRKTIATQFYVESALFTCISFLLGYVLCYAFTPWFLNILQLKIDNSFLYSPLVLSLFSGLLLITIALAGSYPSLILSAFKPVVTLKGKMSKQAGGTTVRKLFTTLQFAISVGLIICGLVIDRQLYFFRHADIGIKRENVVMIPMGNSMGKNYQAFKKEVQSLAGIASVTTAHNAMFKGFDMFFVDGKTKNESTGVVSLIADENFMTTLGLKWKFAPPANAELSGRHRMLINEEAVAKLHLPANPVGSFVKSGTDRIEITGVLKNFNFTSMENSVRPMGLFIMKDTSAYYSKWGYNLFVKINPHTNLPSMLSAMQSLYKKYDSDTPFDYTFMDDAFNQQYKAEDRLASIFSLFTIITVVLATLGLFGLAAFTIEQRTKEIGIRKILGASLSGIAALLSADFLKLIVLAILIASPIAWWTMNKWLQGFAYRINIAWWMFVAAGLLAMVTAVLTISYHAIRAAVSNPVKSLRSE